MSFQNQNFRLSPSQLQSIRKGLENNAPVSIRLRATQIGEGPHMIPLTQRQMNKFAKNLQQNKGGDLTLSKTQLKMLRKSGSGILEAIGSFFIKNAPKLANVSKAVVEKGKQLAETDLGKKALGAAAVASVGIAASVVQSKIDQRRQARLEGKEASNATKSLTQREKDKIIDQLENKAEEIINKAKAKTQKVKEVEEIVEEEEEEDEPIKKRKPKPKTIKTKKIPKAKLPKKSDERNLTKAQKRALAGAGLHDNPIIDFKNITHPKKKIL